VRARARVCVWGRGRKEGTRRLRSFVHISPVDIRPARFPPFSNERAAIGYRPRGSPFINDSIIDPLRRVKRVDHKFVQTTSRERVPRYRASRRGRATLEHLRVRAKLAAAPAVVGPK